MVAVLPQNLVQGGDHRAEKGRGHGGKQNADAAAAVGLQPPGEGIGPVVQRRDGAADGFQVFRTDIAAIEIFGNGRDGDAGQLGYVLDGCHGMFTSTKRFAKNSAEYPYYCIS